MRGADTCALGHRSARARVVTVTDARAMLGRCVLVAAFIRNQSESRETIKFGHLLGSGGPLANVLQSKLPFRAPIRSAGQLEANQRGI